MMPQQEVLPESERLKSTVDVDLKAAMRSQGFQLGDEVKFEVKETTKEGTSSSWKRFTVASAQIVDGSWKYQLRDGNELHDAWIPEAKLRFPA